MAGFGSLSGEFGDAGVPAPPPPEDLAQATSDDIAAIRHKYVDGRTNLRQSLRLAANQALPPIKMDGQPMDSILLTVTSGTIYVYLYDVSSNNGKTATPDPDLAVSAAIQVSSSQIMIPLREDYQIGIQEGANAAAIGNIRLMKL